MDDIFAITSRLPGLLPNNPIVAKKSGVAAGNVISDGIMSRRLSCCL